MTDERQSKAMLRNYLVTGPANAERCQTRYPSKPLEISSYCPSDSIFYFNRKGELHRIDVRDNSIWQSINDNSLGFECPTGFQRKIRKGKTKP